MTTKTGPARRPWCIRCAGYGHLKEKCIATVSVYGDNLKKRLPCKHCGFYGHEIRECVEEKMSIGDTNPRSGDIV
ncbi:unnamed protein product [Pylaiella littoralis]